MLFTLCAPTYDNAEEKKTIDQANKIAKALDETPMTNHNPPTFISKPLAAD